MRSKHEIRFPSARIIHEQRDFDCSKIDVVIVALPSNAIGEILRAGGRIAAPHTAFVSRARGIDGASGLMPNRIIRNNTGSSYIAVISSASVPDEMLLGRPVYVSLACINPYLGQLSIDRLQNPSLRFSFTDDLCGWEIAGVGKSIIALGSGIADGLDLGENFRASFIARGIVALRSAIERLGGRPETMLSPGALSDVILTSSSVKSCNYMHGRAQRRREREAPLGGVQFLVVIRAFAEGARHQIAFFRSGGSCRRGA